MKNIYFQFYSLTNSEIKELWENAVFIFDTNVLFNFYRYSDESRTEFLKTITKLKKRVWMPYQVGFEFHKNRIMVIIDEGKNHTEFQKKFESIYLEVENKNRNPFFSKKTQEALVLLRENIKKEIDSKIQDLEKRIHKDDVLEQLQNIYSTNIGQQPSTETLTHLYKQGEQRMKDNIPPGYEDKHKPIPEKYGDFLIWMEVIEFAKTEKKSIIFITDDSKDDWWYRVSGKTISPRHELIKEFKEKTDQTCHFYKPFEFLKYSNEYLGSKNSPDTITEVKNLVANVKTEYNYIIIEVKLKSLREEDIFRLSNLIQTDGYEIVLDSLKVNEYLLSIRLPNIPDLTRRLEKKYLDQLNIFNLEKISLGYRYE